MLEPLGVPELEERVYRSLLANPRVSLRRIGEVVPDVPKAQLRAALAALEQKGLLSRTAGKATSFIPAPPDLALEALLQRRQADLDRIRVLARQLIEEFHDASSPTDPMDFAELVKGRVAVDERRAQLERSAKEQVAALSTPPYATPTPLNEDEPEMLGRGVRYRMIYSQEALEVPGLLEGLERDVALGEEARVLETVPLKLLLVDGRIGLVPVSSPRHTIEGAILVTRSPLLNALVILFEMLWDRAVPFKVAAQADGVREEPDEAQLSPDNQRLLALILSGLTDDAIARRLGCAPRTLRRRIATLLDLLNARNRFQAGFIAAKRGYL